MPLAAGPLVGTSPPPRVLLLGQHASPHLEGRADYAERSMWSILGKISRLGEWLPFSFLFLLRSDGGGGVPAARAFLWNRPMSIGQIDRHLSGTRDIITGTKGSIGAVSGQGKASGERKGA